MFSILEESALCGVAEKNKFIYITYHIIFIREFKNLTKPKLKNKKLLCYFCLTLALSPLKETLFFDVSMLFVKHLFN